MQIYLDNKTFFYFILSYIRNKKRSLSQNLIREIEFEKLEKHI